MKKTFNYNKIGVALADEIVEGIYKLTQKYCEGKSETPEYKQANAVITDKFMKYCAESVPGVTYSSLEDIKNPQLHKNVFFTTTFETVLAQAISPAIPTVIAQGYDKLYETT